MLKVDILTKESCGGIPSYDHLITIVFVSQGGRFHACFYRFPHAVNRIIFTTAFTESVSVAFLSVPILADDAKFVLFPHYNTKFSLFFFLETVTSEKQFKNNYSMQVQSETFNAQTSSSQIPSSVRLLFKTLIQPKLKRWYYIARFFN